MLHYLFIKNTAVEVISVAIIELYLCLITFSFFKKYDRSYTWKRRGRFRNPDRAI